MKNEPLQRAIKKAGGVTRLAQALNITQPSVTLWKRVPARHVLIIEALTGVSRHELRPDIFGHLIMPGAQK